MKGEGDRKALEIMAEATGKDPQFFAFWRSLLAYSEAFKPENTTLSYRLTANFSNISVVRRGSNGMF